MRMPQQQALSPVALAQRYAQRRENPLLKRALLPLSTVLVIGLLLLIALPALLGSAQPLPLLALIFLMTFWLPMLITRANTERREEAELYAQLLAILKDDTLPLSLVDRVTLLAALPVSTQPPLIGLAQARLAQKLAYASPTELAALPRAPLHAWLRALETPDELRIALLLALGSLQDHAIRPLAQEIAHLAPTERLHEAALECLASLESSR